MNRYLIIIVGVFLVSQFYSLYSQSVGITDGPDDFTPDASSLLELKTTTRGFLMPRMNAAQRNAISNPAAGLMVVQTDNQVLTYNLATLQWEASDIDATTITGILDVANGGTGVSTITGMVKGNGTSAMSGISNLAGNITIWSDDNTIGGNDNFTWDVTNNILNIDGSISLTQQQLLHQIQQNDSSIMIILLMIIYTIMVRLGILPAQFCKPRLVLLMETLTALNYFTLLQEFQGKF